MSIMDWLLNREKTWVVYYITKDVYFIVDNNATYVQNPQRATRFTKSEAKRLATEFSYTKGAHTIIELP